MNPVLLPLHQKVWRCLGRWLMGLVVVIGVAIALFPNTAAAARIDPYVARYFNASEPVALPYSPDGTARSYSAEAFSQGKHLFEESCLNCHVGGITLPDPEVSLSLSALQAATPPRDTIQSLMQFFREPMTYDGGEPTIWCRQVSPGWMDDAALETLAAFILRAAEKAPGWGSADLL